MSSLAGALDDYSHSRQRPMQLNQKHSSDDVEMNSASLSPKNEHEDNDEEEPEDEDDEDEKADAEMSDLFGNDNDVVEQRHARTIPTSPTASGPDSERLLSPERERRQALEYGEDDALQEMLVEVKEAEVRFPNLPVPKSSDGDNWVIRLPKFVKMDTKPFHYDTYIGPEQEDEELLHGDSQREKSMTIKMKVENTLRWRWAKDAAGQDKKESNTRIIRWSDGSLSLRLGKALFDINQSVDTSASVVRQTVGGTSSQSQSQLPLTLGIPGKPQGQGLTYLVAQHKRSQVLQSEAVITGYMSLRPTGMQSETHLMLVRAVEQKHNKVARLKMAPDPAFDPEREKMEMIRQSAKKPRKKTDEGDGLGGRKRRNYRRAADHDVMWSDDEDDDHGDIYGGDDEDDDEGLGHSRSPRKLKRKSTGEKEEEDYQADDFVVPDESEDGEEGTRRKRVREVDEPEDDLERMEATLEKQAAAERRSRSGGIKSSKQKTDHDEGDSDDDGAGAMDVESEEEDEEEEEYKVRRVTSKRAIAFDEDEE